MEMPKSSNWMLWDLGLDKCIAKTNVYQSGKRGTTNSRGNWSTKKWLAEETAVEGFVTVDTEIVEETPLDERDARWKFFIIITRIMGLRYHQNNYPGWFGCNPSYDVLHISAEIRFDILRRWEKGRSHKYGGLCLLGRLGCEMGCSREDREVWGWTV